MSELLTVLLRSGVPPIVLVLLVIAYLIADKKGILRRKVSRKEISQVQREMLSADEETFRRALMDQMEGLVLRCDKAEKAHTDCLEAQRQAAEAHRDCQRRLQELYEFMNELLDKVKSAGVTLLMDLSPPAPYTETTAQLKQQHKEK